MAHRTTPDGKLVTRITLCLGDGLQYEAYEPSYVMGPHATIAFHDGKCWGSIASRRFESVLPAGPGRTAACEAHYKAVEQEALATVYAAWPEAQHGHPTFGSRVVVPGKVLETWRCSKSPLLQTTPLGAVRTYDGDLTNATHAHGVNGDSWGCDGTLTPPVA